MSKERIAVEIRDGGISLVVPVARVHNEEEGISFELTDAIGGDLSHMLHIPPGPEPEKEEGTSSEQIKRLRDLVDHLNYHLKVMRHSFLVPDIRVVEEILYLYDGVPAPTDQVKVVGVGMP